MVTVVMCTYNDSHLMLPGLQSCLQQDTEVEVVVVDDHSTLPMNEDVKRFMKDNGIQVIRHIDCNRGLSAARNTGISCARSEFVIPLDADDFFMPNVLSDMERAFDDDTDVVYGNLWIAGHIDYPLAQPWTKGLLKHHNPLFCSSMFRKRLWEQVGGYLVREGPHYEDWQFWNKCFLAGARFRYIDKIVYEHVNREDSMLKKLGLDREKYIKIATECLEQ